ncbi:helicase associated domain-containing protein [Pseudarthrobacter siccitolerans]
MTQAKRSAPNPEWVLMYRQGNSAPKIAAGAGAAPSVVRYHLAIAAKLEPGLRGEHQKALPPAGPRLTVAGQRNLDDILAFYVAEGRLPVSGRSARESALAAWLQRRRKEAAEGALSPAYADLDQIPGWREHVTKRCADEARWKQRLDEVAAYLAAGNQWPRHNKTEDQEERTLGVWLHTQRITRRAGKLDAAKEKQLDEVVPGWRQGRGGGVRAAAAAMTGQAV